MRNSIYVLLVSCIHFFNGVLHYARGILWMSFHPPLVLLLIKAPSNLFLAGVDEVSARDIKELFGFKQATLSKQFGRPAPHFHVTSSHDFANLVERSSAHLKSRTSSYLSYAGKEHLSKVVLFGNQV